MSLWKQEPDRGASCSAVEEQGTVFLFFVFFLKSTNGEMAFETSQSLLL